jgi:hypothetical protein
MATIAAVVSDLMLGSRVEEGLRRAGHEVSLRPGLPDDLASYDAIVCDLDAADAGDVAGTGLPSLGFYQHTDVETRRAAEEAGIDVVVPRSRMVRELPELIERLLGPDRG